MSTITSHQDLVVWQKSLALASRVYAATRQLPSDERRGLGRQLRRAVVSIPSGIATGAARRSRNEFIQFLHIARGSLSKVETQMMIALDQGLLPKSAAALEEIAEVERLLNRLIMSLTRSRQSAHARACTPHQPPTATTVTPCGSGP